MTTLVHEFDWPDRFVVGTLGKPGGRTFYLQARDGARVVSVILEKEQSALLAEKVDEILDQIMLEDGNRYSVPSSTPVELIDEEPLDTPVDGRFRVGTIGLGWEPATAQVILEVIPVVEVELEIDADVDTEALEAELARMAGLDELVEAAEPEELLRVRIPVGSARAFAKRTLEIVGAGRSLCPRCGLPMDPEGHNCPADDGL
ncbi:DUF3090 domain-containing protein [Pseudoclavibacter helvolus]|uniref:DUF3090 domain-containing protein n=1 Tax=Pseudoclavibacter helvolus TaxID=255205 RepID=UPI00083939D6|nr:DUF3090 domain-containing protein [Pseudoclavibacter helvolus]